MTNWHDCNDWGDVMAREFCERCLTHAILRLERDWRSALPQLTAPPEPTGEDWRAVGIASAILPALDDDPARYIITAFWERRIVR